MTAARKALRFFIGAVLVVTAAGKLLDVSGFAAVIRTYRVFPEPVLLPLAVLVPLAELSLGAWLFSGRRLFSAAVAAFGMHVVYAAWSASALARGLELSNCGCFGVFLPRPLGWATVAEDAAMAVGCATLAALCRPALARAAENA